jgi:hypothetical protein
MDGKTYIHKYTWVMNKCVWRYVFIYAEVCKIFIYIYIYYVKYNGKALLLQAGSGLEGG